MPDVRLIWTLRYHGWAFCSVMDDDASAEAVASQVTDGPEQLLRAVARVVLYETDTQAEFEAVLRAAWRTTIQPSPRPSNS
jgi:hypothetical protein